MEDNTSISDARIQLEEPALVPLILKYPKQAMEKLINFGLNENQEGHLITGPWHLRTKKGTV
jgi:hypothetical protein